MMILVAALRFLTDSTLVTAERLASTLSSIKEAAAAMAAMGTLAQPPGGQGEFVPLGQLQPTEQLPAAPLLIAAYAFVWIAVTLYVWSIRRRLDRVEADMQALERRTSTTGQQTKSSH